MVLRKERYFQENYKNQNNKKNFIEKNEKYMVRYEDEDCF